MISYGSAVGAARRCRYNTISSIFNPTLSLSIVLLLAVNILVYTQQLRVPHWVSDDDAVTGYSQLLMLSDGELIQFRATISCVAQDILRLYLPWSIDDPDRNYSKTNDDGKVVSEITVHIDKRLAHTVDAAWVSPEDTSIKDRLVELQIPGLASRMLDSAVVVLYVHHATGFTISRHSVPMHIPFLLLSNESSSIQSFSESWNNACSTDGDG